MIGTTVSRYTILAKIGGGGMGVVYEAKDLELGRRVAIKFLPEKTTNVADALERFKREARAASALNHPHICTVHDVGTHEGRPFLVMERLAGESLNHAIGETGMPVGRVVELALQITDALEAAHRAGIVHRDLKPANLFLTERGEVKVLDFGLAKMASAETPPMTADAPTVAGPFLTAAGTTLGTVAYMSPEQARGVAVDARSDLFSLGVVLYEMATGVLPFEGESNAEFFAEILKSDPPPPSGWNREVPPRFDQILLKALQKDPALRYQSAAELSEDLLQLQREGSGAETVAGGLAARAVPARPRRHARLGAAAAAAVVLALLGAGAWRLLREPAPPPTRLSVLVGDTVNRTGDETFDDTLSELLTASLNQSQLLSVFPRARAAAVLRLMQRDPETAIDETVGLEICQREGIGAFVATSISRLGSAYLLLVRVTSPLGKELASARESFDDAAETPARIDTLVRTLRSEVGESAASIRASSRPLAEVSSASLEAVKFYTLGAQHLRQGDPAQALVLYRKALEIDPDFAMAQDAIGLVYTNLQDMARAEEHLAKAVALSGRVAEAERHKILADYDMLRRNYDVACDHLQVLTELRPLDAISFMALGICRSFQLDFAGAVEATEYGLEMQPYPHGRAILARFQLGNGEPEKALATARALLDEQPNLLQARFVAGRAELALGRLDEARATFETLAAHGGGLEAEGRLGLADLALAAGDTARAHEELEEAWQVASRRKIAAAMGNAATARAELALAAGRSEEVERAVRRLDGIRYPLVLYLKVRCLARAGRLDEAAAALAELDAVTSDPAPDQAMRAMARAELALAAGRLDEARREADAAWGFEASVLARETQARVYEAAGSVADAARFYEEVLARGAQRLDSYDAPGFHRLIEVKYRLARLLDDAGEPARARPYLEELVRLWVAADAALAAPADARRRLAATS